MVLLWIFTYDSTVGVRPYPVSGECTLMRHSAVDVLSRGRSFQHASPQQAVAIARNTYNVFSIVCGVLNTYMQNPTAWNWKAYSAFFWVGACQFSKRTPGC